MESVPILYPLRKDIFLDFLSPDNRLLFGTYSNLSDFTHQKYLEESLNIAVFLCGEKCLLPPSFVTQCNIVRAALETKREFLTHSLVVLPLREKTLFDFFEKKIAEYSSVKHVYKGLFEVEGRRFVSHHSHLVRKRFSEMGSTIATKWEAGPDESEAWSPIKERMSHSQIEKVRAIPKILKEEGKSVTWPAFEKYVDVETKQHSFYIDQAIQHEYTKTYLDEYEATTISGLPIKQTNLCFPIKDLSYDYEGLRAALAPLGLWEIIRTIRASDIVYLRSTLGWYEFISAFDNSCKIFKDRLRHYFTFIAQGPGSQLKKSFRSLQRIVMSVREGSTIGRDDADLISNVLLEASMACASQLRVTTAEQSNLNNFTWLSVRGVAMKKVFIVHGQNHDVRDKIDLFLRDLGLKTIVMAAGAHAGRSLPEKFEEMAKCDFAVFLLTADDELQYISSSRSIKRARQNVVLEIGYFWGSIGRRGNVAFLVEDNPEMELPSDIQGLGWIPITSDLGDTKLKLQAELADAGLI